MDMKLSYYTGSIMFGYIHCVQQYDNDGLPITPTLQDMTFWMRDKQEVEIVDFLLQVKASMVSELFLSSQSHIMNGSACMYNYRRIRLSGALHF